MKEFKNIQLKDIDLKFEGESRKFSGYASVFGGNDSYGDTVMPGAFTKTLAAYGMPKCFTATSGDFLSGSGPRP